MINRFFGVMNFKYALVYKADLQLKGNNLGYTNSLQLPLREDGLRSIYIFRMDLLYDQRVVVDFFDH